MTEYKKQQKGRNWIVLAPNGQIMGSYRYEVEADARIKQLEEFERQQEEAAREPIEEEVGPKNVKMLKILTVSEVSE